MTRLSVLLILSACGGDSAQPPDPDPSPDAAVVDPPPPVSLLGSVSGVVDQDTCVGAPQGSTCKHVTVAGCPAIETETLGATIAILEPATTARGTVVHFAGGGGDRYEATGSAEYRAAGLRQVFVAWDSDWEQTASLGIKTAACRPATLLRWVYDTVHGGSTELAFCGQGRSGGSGAFTYALAHYHLDEQLDYVNLISGPPFARIDLGCDGDAPASTTVCGDPVTMQLREKVDNWENTAACGTTGVAPDVIAKWREDSVAIGGTYAYPNTRVEMFDCTNQASAVTGMSRLFFDLLDPHRAGYHCYSAADDCHGEGLGNRGDSEAFQALIDGCLPGH